MRSLIIQFDMVLNFYEKLFNTWQCSRSVNALSSEFHIIMIQIAHTLIGPVTSQQGTGSGTYIADNNPKANPLARTASLCMVDTIANNGGPATAKKRFCR